jgi:dipeptidase E
MLLIGVHVGWKNAGVRMLLTSNGPQDDITVDAMKELLGGRLADARLVVVVDAILPFGGDKSTLLEHLGLLHRLGWAEFDIVSVLGGPRGVVEERLRAADVVLGYGGSNHWLAHAWAASGHAPLLRELLDDKVYVGWSAGSMIFSRLQAAAVEAFGDDELRRFGLESSRPAVPLFDWFLMPHLGADYLPEQTPEWAAQHAPLLGGPSWFLDDATALVVRDPAAEPEVRSAGRWLRFDAAGTLVASG